MADVTGDEPTPSVATNDDVKRQKQPSTVLSSEPSKKVHRMKRLLYVIGTWFIGTPIRVLVIPYIIGIIWHLVHPFSSILTGDLNHARRWYIDENSIDPNHFQMYGNYQMILQTKGIPSKDRTLLLQKDDNNNYNDDITITSLCHGIRINQRMNGIHVPCYQYRTSIVDNDHTSSRNFEIAKIIPIGAGIVPGNEAIVLVFPSFVPFVNKRYKILNHTTTTTTMNHTINIIEKSRAQFQASILQFIRRLSSPVTSPWLSKIIFIIAPLHTQPDDEHPQQNDGDTVSSSSSMVPILETTLESFLNVYYGINPRKQYDDVYVHHPLPPEYLGCILRHVIVLDLELFDDNTTTTTSNMYNNKNDKNLAMNEIRILPHGRRGVLPNMDLVFLSKVVLERSTMVTTQQQLNIKHSQKYNLVDVVVHPYTKPIEEHMSWLQTYIDQYIHQYPMLVSILSWYRSVLQLLAFELILAIGPYPPHTPALERGIDALTIQGHFLSATDHDDYDISKGNIPKTKMSPQQYPLEFVQRMELIVRGLSNLHERLHHSTSLYLLVSKDRFVKHEEYLIPNLLLIIPLIMRALLYMFVPSSDESHMIRSNYFSVVGQTFAFASLWLVISSILLNMGKTIPGPFISSLSIIQISYQHGMVLFYVLFLVLYMWLFKPRQIKNSQRTVQCLTCIVALIMHLSIAFGHVSLAYPSALLWTPLLAFPSYNSDSNQRGRIKHILIVLFNVGLFIATCPFTCLVPYIFPTFTPYIRYVYMPLHFLFCVQHILPNLNSRTE